MLHKPRLSLEHYFTFFFFQAEDGIRYHCVTGVQTCALPIFLEQLSAHPFASPFADQTTVALPILVSAFKLPFVPFLIAATEPRSPFFNVPIGHTQDVPLASREAGLPTLTTRQQTQHLPKELCPISWQGRDEHPNHGGKQNLEAYLQPFGLVPLGGK